MSMAESLQEALTPQFIDFGPFSVPESVVISWIIIFALGVVFWLCSHRAKIKPGKFQLMGELFVSGMDSFITGMLGEKMAVLSPYFGALALYLCFANLSGLFDITPPTKDLNVTAGLAAMSFCVIYGSLFRLKGLRGGLKRFIEPSIVMLPFNMIDMVARPLSLCMRLFGNIFGGFVVMTLLHHVMPAVAPPIFGLYFDLFDGLIQMAVFVFLTVLFTQDVLD